MEGGQGRKKSNEVDSNRWDPDESIQSINVAEMLPDHGRKSCVTTRRQGRRDTIVSKSERKGRARAKF